MSILEKYRSMAYGGTAEVPDSPFSNIVSPFKKQVDNTADAIADMNRVIPFTEQQSASVKVLNPHQQEINTPIIPVATPLDPIPSQQSSIPWPKELTSSVRTIGLDRDKFRADTLRQESGSNYSARSKTSSAVGAYQFLWGSWGHEIQNVTGIKDPNEFIRNPKAQDKFFDYYTSKVVAPAVDSLMPLAKKYNLSANDIAKIIHFQGVHGARKALEQNLLNDKQKLGNPTINQYLSRNTH